MDKWIILLTILVVVALPVTVLSQNITRADLEVFFQWFPAGEYYGIYSFDQETLNREELQALANSGYQTIWTQNFKFKQPLFLKNNCTRWIAAFFKPGEVQDPEKTENSLTVAFSVFLTENQTAQQIENLALERNLIIDTGETVSDLPVYRSIAKADARLKSGYLLFSPTQQIVFVHNKEDLRLIAETGFGMRPSILEDESIRILLDKADLLGPLWEAHNLLFSIRRLLEEEEAGEATGKELDKLESLLVDQPLLTISTLILDEDTITDRWFKIYDGREQAEKALSKYKRAVSNLDLPRQLAEEEKQSTLIRNEASKPRLEGPVLIVDLVLDEDILSSFRLAVEKIKNR